MKLKIGLLKIKQPNTYQEVLEKRLVKRHELLGSRVIIEPVLKGKDLSLITTEGNPVLLKALKEIYPFLKVQRCIVHKLRNVAINLKWVHMQPCMAEAKGIFQAPIWMEAIKQFWVWEEKWQVEEDRAVRCLEKDFYHCMYYYSFPKELWTRFAPPTCWSGLSKR